MERKTDLERYILTTVKEGTKAKYTLYDFLTDEYNDRDEVNQHIQYLYSDGLIDGHYDCYDLVTEVYGVTNLGDEFLAQKA